MAPAFNPATCGVCPSWGGECHAYRHRKAFIGGAGAGQYQENASRILAPFAACAEGGKTTFNWRTPLSRPNSRSATVNGIPRGLADWSLFSTQARQKAKVVDCGVCGPQVDDSISSADLWRICKLTPREVAACTLAGVRLARVSSAAPTLAR